MLTLWSPWRTLTQEFDLLARASESQQTTTYRPRADIVEADDHYRLDLDLPGLDASAVAVTVEQGVLSIAGERKADTTDEPKGYYRFERCHGPFVRSFNLPSDADAEHITATSKHGVLTVRIPKLASARPRSIEVTTLS